MHREGFADSWTDASMEESKTNIKMLSRKTHQTIKKVTEDIETFKFNTAISSIMELVNEIYRVSDRVLELGPPEIKKAIETVVILLSPFAPHIAEEMWKGLGNEKGIFEEARIKRVWPDYDSSQLVEDKVTIVVQINGKVRSKIEVPAGIEEARLKEIVLADEKTKQWLGGKPVKNFVVVPNRLVSIVV